MFPPKISRSSSSWWNLFLATFLAACAYVFFEWLFLVTKPSFMSAIGFAQKLEILVFSSLLLYALSALVLIPLVLLGWLPFLRRFARVWIAIGALLPALILGGLSLLLLDNFTYTILSFGIVKSQGVIRWVYAALFLLAVVLWWVYLRKKIGELRWPNPSTWSQKVLYPGLVLAILVPFPVIAYRLFDQRQHTSILSNSNAIGVRPHILMITSDGMNATSLSLYGYERDTTPNLLEQAKGFLVAENAFTNSGATTGSLVSIYTGKHPARTRVLYPPDILRGADAYQHLPAILKSLGYYTVQITMPHYADALTQNVLDGFDRVNGRDAGNIGSLSAFNRYVPIDYANFIKDLYQRQVERLAHIFYLADMADPYSQVTEPAKNLNLDEKRKLRSALKMLEAADQPTFIHIHLFGTHGPHWYPIKQFFSAGQDPDQQKRWNVDFYDDSIREFDQMAGMVIKELDKKGLLDNTVVIFGSDHGKANNNLQRIPLLIRFPHLKHAGVIQDNVQNMDLAPTILDYLGWDKPDWMEGQSLLKTYSSQRPIFTVMNITALRNATKTGFTETDLEKSVPPFYQFGAASVVYCQRWYRLVLAERTMEVGDFLGHTAPCPEDQLLTPEQAFNLLVDYLKSNQFDVSSLQDFELISKQP